MQDQQWTADRNGIINASFRMRWGLVSILTLAAMVGTPAMAQVWNRTPQIAEAEPEIEWPIHYGRYDRQAMALAAGLPGTPEYHLREFLDLHSAERYDDALVAAERVCQLAPERGLSHYNLACVLCLLGRQDEAFVALDRALESGWRNELQARLDGDLAQMRRDARFDDWIGRVRSAKEKEELRQGRRPVGPWDESARDIARRIPELARRYHVPGMAVALIDQGDVVWTHGYGYADATTGRLFDVTQPFLSPAVRDLLTLVAAVQIDQSHGIRLDELLTRRLTGRHSGRHSGRPDQSAAGRLASGGTASPFGAPADLSRWPDLTTGDAGARLRSAISLRAGMPFGTFVERHVFVPFEMRSTQLSPESDALNAAASGHSRLGTCLTPGLPADDKEPQLLTTTEDLARLVAVLAKVAPADDDGANGVADETRLRDQLLNLASLGLPRIGLPIECLEGPDGTVLQIAAVTDGVGCLIRVFPEDGTGIVIVFNSVTGIDAALRVAQELRGPEGGPSE